MAQLGEYNYLQIIKEVEFGYFLDGDEKGEILLLKDKTQQPFIVDEWVEVFLYLDSEDRIIATTLKPKGVVNQFSYLPVAQINPVGAFLDWGLPKDLLVPFHEQKVPMVEGEHYLVYIYLDERSERITASSRFDRFLDYFNQERFKAGETIELLVQSITDLGYKCIINDSHWGVLYKNEVYQPLEIGDSVKAYIKQIREDDRIDLCLHQPGYDKIEGIAADILKKLKEKDGFIPVSDKSAPELIYKTFGISKKAYKKAIGGLYKQRLVVLEKEGVRLVKNQ